MNSHEYVTKLINDLKAQGKKMQDIAWQAALACVGWAYVFGARGEYCEPSNRRSRAREDHPTIKSACKNFSGADTNPKGCVGCKWYLGPSTFDSSDPHKGRTRFFDCRGFTYWILKQVYNFTLQGGGATSQWNTAANWKSKGAISSMPKNTLVCLFVKKGNVMEHTGFGYNDETCECSAGVQYFAKRNKKWTHWAIPACIDDPTPTPPEPTPPSPEPSSAKTFVVTGKNVAFRESPGGKIITRIPTGSTVKEAVSDNTWQLVTINNKTGYMMKEFIKEK